MTSNVRNGFSFAEESSGAKLGVWDLRRLMVFGLLLLLPITCLGMCMGSRRRFRQLSTCFLRVRLRSRLGGMQFDRLTPSGVMCAGFWMRRQRMRLS